MISWIFFDVGNVILNDDPAMALLYKYIHDAINKNNNNVSFTELLAARENALQNHHDGLHYQTVGLKYLGEQEWNREFKIIRRQLSAAWGKISPLMPPIVPIIKKAAQKFNLGLIANQPREVVKVLGEHNLLQYFKVNAVSAVAGFTKPDLRIFKYALTAASCLPEEAIMIGDRIDNDIVPAKKLRIKTIWLKLPLNLKGYTPRAEYEKLYFQSINKISASHIAPQSSEEQPDFIAQSFDELMAILENL